MPFYIITRGQFIGPQGQKLAPGDIVELGLLDASTRLASQVRPLTDAEEAERVAKLNTPAASPPSSDFTDPA